MCPKCWETHPDSGFAVPHFDDEACDVFRDNFKKEFFREITRDEANCKRHKEQQAAAKAKKARQQSGYEPHVKKAEEAKADESEDDVLLVLTRTI